MFRYMDFGVFDFAKILEFYLKWAHMARYGPILKLDGALWLRIISKPLLTLKKTIQKESKRNPKPGLYSLKRPEPIAITLHMQDISN